jgi:hypothetical protein
MSDDDPARQTDELLREYLRDRDVPCPSCGYNLRNLMTTVCPECRCHVLRLVFERAARSHVGFVAAICPSCAMVCIGVVALVAGIVFGDIGDVMLILSFALLDAFVLTVLTVGAADFITLRWRPQLTTALALWIVHGVLFFMLAAML